MIKYLTNNFKFCNFCSQFVELIETGEDRQILVDKKVVGAGRRFARCPKCTSADRTRLFKLWLDEYLEDNKENNIVVMHIAPESIVSRIIESYSNITYIKGDLLDDYEYPEDVQRIDIQNIEYNDNSIDLFIASHVLEHVEDDIKALNEIFRILKPGGKAAIQIPYSIILATDRTPTNNEYEREQLFGQHDHLRLYGYDFPDILQSVGFEVEEYLPDDYVAQLLGLNKNEKLFILNKPAVI